jgi:outer membrane protein
MRTTLLLFLALALLGPAAAAEQKIGVIDLRKVFDDYFKTKAADQILKDKAAKLDKERKNHMQDYEKIAEEYKKALEDANNQAVSADERDKRKKAAEGKLLEIKELESTITQFDNTARRQLEEEQRLARDKIVAEIKNVVSARARSGGYSVVLDSAAESANLLRTPVFLYTDGSNDLTTEVLNELNASAPPTSTSDSNGSKSTDNKDKK